MILESSSLASAEPARTEASRSNLVRARDGAAAASAQRSYARVAGEVAENQAKETSAPAKPAEPAKGGSLWQNDTFGFGDLIDIINPLQHIPIVATIYRRLTDDNIGMVPRVAGGALWGRVGGLVTGIVNSVVEWFTGKDIGDHILAAVWGDRPAVDTSNIVQAQKSAPENRQDAAVENRPEVTPVPDDSLTSLAPSMPQAATQPPMAPPKMAPLAPAAPMPSDVYLRPPAEFNYRRGSQQLEELEQGVTLRVIA